MKQPDLHAHFTTRQSSEAGQDSCDHSINNTLASVTSQSALINTSHMVKKVEETFDDDPELAGVIIIDENDAQLLGMISRKRFMEMYSKPFRKDLHNKKPLKLLVKYDFDTPLCLQESDNIDQAVRIALTRPHDQMYEPIVVHSVNRGLKLIDMQVLLLELAKVYQRQSMELQETLSRVKQLEGIIAICSYCKKIRNDTNSWDQLETYISSHSEALFSHSICPECFKQQMEELKKSQ
jgi:thioredoxin-related protein